MVCVADKTPLREGAKDRFKRSYEDWNEMLDSETLDALLVTSDNQESAEIAVEALHRGIPCMVEKPMATSHASAAKMLAAMRESGKTLMINWPLAWNPWLHELKRRVDAQEIGTPFHLRFRIGHHGPREIGCDEYFVGWLYDEDKNGGGAIADFASYGAVLARWLLGKPQSVLGVRDNFTKDYFVPDDHALILMRYDKATAYVEGTWATKEWDDGPNPVVHGSEGTLYVRGDQLLRNGEAVAVAPIATLNPAEYFLNCVERGEIPEGIVNPEIAADACRIVDAAKESSAGGRAVSL